MKNKTELARDERGFVRYLGKDANGKQVKFRLGGDLVQAGLRAAKLVALWSRIEATGRTTWDNAELLLAKAIARGDRQAIFVDEQAQPNHPQYAKNLAAVLADLHNSYGDLIEIRTAQPAIYDKGEALNRAAYDAIAKNVAFPVAPLASGTLHEALDDYRAYLADLPDASGHFYKRQEAIDRLKEHHADLLLADMSEQRMWSMLEHWAKRPHRKGTDRPISRFTAADHMKRLREFWRWLHRSEKYEWRRPDGWDEMRVPIRATPEDRERRSKALVIDTFSVSELKTLYQTASPLVRSWMLLGLNCGMKQAEVSSLTRTDVFLNAVHPEAEMIGVPAIKGDWIRRLRGKTGVYGEWQLWSETADAIKWAVARAEKIGEKKLVFVSKDGNPYNTKTKGGNKSGRIANLWNDCLRKSGLPEDRRLSFKMLEKTAATMIRRSAGGEVSGLFECHGQAVATDTLADIYANRPFAKLHEALKALREKLSPMFH